MSHKKNNTAKQYAQFSAFSLYIYITLHQLFLLNLFNIFKGLPFLLYFFTLAGFQIAHVWNVTMQIPLNDLAQQLVTLKFNLYIQIYIFKYLSSLSKHLQIFKKKCQSYFLLLQFYITVYLRIEEKHELKNIYAYCSCRILKCQKINVNLHCKILLKTFKANLSLNYQ